MALSLKLLKRTSRPPRKSSAPATGAPAPNERLRLLLVGLAGSVAGLVAIGLVWSGRFRVAPDIPPYGWVGGLGAFGGFVIPPAMAFAVSDLGARGYAVGFIVFVVLSLAAMSVMWVLKYGTAVGHQAGAAAATT